MSIRFRDYGDHLIFAGTNEVMKDGDYGTPNQELLTVQKGYNQTFVNTVRATGGRNTYRYLLVQAFNTNIDHAVNYFQLPSDKSVNRLMLEVHFYDPYEFTIDGNNTTITQWGKNGAPAKKTTWDSDESHIDAMFAKMKSTFIDKGIPVILGEYSAMLKNTADNPPFRLAWNKYVTEAAIKVGMVPFYWDPGFVSTGSSGLFDRNTGKPVHTDVIKAIVEAAPKVALIPVHNRQTINTNSLIRMNNQLSSQGRTAILLYNPAGRLVRTSTFNGKNTVLSLNGLNSGLYIAEMGPNTISVMSR